MFLLCSVFFFFGLGFFRVYLRAHASYMCMQAQSMRTHTTGLCAHAYVCARILVPRNLKLSFLLLFIYLFHIICLCFVIDDELKIEPTPILPWELSGLKRQEWSSLVGRSSMGMKVVHQESAWMTPNTWEISRKIYLQKLVNRTTCYYFATWARSWFIVITSY